MSSPLKRKTVSGGDKDGDDGDKRDAFTKAAKKVVERRSKRVKKTDPTAIVWKDLDLIDRVQYKPADDTRAGGIRSTAILGPGALRSEDSDANPNKPAAIKAVRKAYPGRSFYAGHLLNSQFGGHGDDAKNLTVLTGTGNGSQKTFDNRVKSAVEALKKAYIEINRLGFPVKDLTYGIRVVAAVSGTWWGDEYPDSCVADGLVCTAEVANEPDLDELLDTAYPDHDIRVTGWQAIKAEAEQQMAIVTALVAEATDAGTFANPKPDD
jgi:hypothetical protein